MTNPVFKVQDIYINKPDAVGETVQLVYAKISPCYAVYLSANRVSIQFADESELQKVQRNSLVKLYGLRSEINALIDGWNATRQNKARGYQRRQAAALIAAAQGDADTAQAVLQKIKDDITEERISSARFIYVYAASAACLAGILLSVLLSRPWIWQDLLSFHDTYVAYLWLAFSAGTVGAFFSLAIAIRKRTILIDLRNRDNIADAFLRILIGGISGAVLIAFLHTGTLSFAIGGVAVSTEPDNWTMILLAAFLAGFSERLIPDLLDKEEASAKAKQPEAAKDANPKPAGATAATLPANNAIAGVAVPVDHEEGADSCASGLDLTPPEVTHDADLPPATGGIAGNQEGN